MKVIICMYNKLTACISTPEGLTEFLKCFIGTRQGCMLSPLLFILYLNKYIEIHYKNESKGLYIDEYFSNLFMLLYADDIAQFSDRVWNLQAQINLLQKYCTLSGMKVNIAKTQIIVFQNGGIVKNNEKWFLNSERIEVVPYYKYLGLFFSSRLNWSYATKLLNVQSSKALCTIKKLNYRCNGLPLKILFEIIDTVVVPIVTYGAEIWGFKKHNEIEAVQLKFYKYVFGVCSQTPNIAVLGECKRFPLFIVYYMKCIKYWLKLVSMEASGLMKSYYHMSLQMCDAGKINWVFFVKNMLYKYGFGFAFLNQGVGDKNNLSHCLNKD